MGLKVLIFIIRSLAGNDIIVFFESATVSEQGFRLEGCKKVLNAALHWVPREATPAIMNIKILNQMDLLNWFVFKKWACCLLKNCQLHKGNSRVMLLISVAGISKNIYYYFNKLYKIFISLHKRSKCLNISYFKDPARSRKNFTSFSANNQNFQRQAKG